MHKAVAALAVAVTILTTPALGKSYCCTPKKNHYLVESVRIKHKQHHPIRQRLYSKVLNTSFLSRFTDLGRFRLTGYTGGDPGQGTGLHTALGTSAAYGNAAVDPHVIPLGSYIYVPDYGLARATDKGSAVGGMHIDLCFGIGGPGSLAYVQAIGWAARHPYEHVYRIPLGLVSLFG